MTGTRETATQLDHAIDRLLRSPAAPRAVDEGELTATARLLRDALPRLHPRFSFEELLASRLAAARRAAGASSAAVPPSAAVVPIRRDLEAIAAESAERLTVGPAAERRRRGLVAGGAIASGVSLALPIAGAALVVWRRSRSSGGIL